MMGGVYMLTRVSHLTRYHFCEMLLWLELNHFVVMCYIYCASIQHEHSQRTDTRAGGVGERQTQNNNYFEH